MAVRNANTVRSHGHLIIPDLPEGEDFPTNAVDGEIIMKQGQIWNYGTMAGVTSWHPVTPPKSVFVHNQVVPSENWSIMHGLDTQALLVTVYSNDTADGSYRLIANPPVSFTDDNNVIVQFSTPVGGRAVIMSQGGAPSATQTLIPKMQEVFGGLKATIGTMDVRGTIRIQFDRTEDY